ncbi:hypothetical protein [Streptomyces sp. NPDC056188]|uniref:hypothetical protein n=1 Tax=Streptomyces sp. NPDC056188 TaxID=3345740 RepID=UPI0035D689A0
MLLVTLPAAYGTGVSFIPSPSDPHRFWIANLAAPFPLIAVVAGLLWTGWVRSMLAGFAGVLSAVIGFYGRGLWNAIFPPDRIVMYYGHLGHGAVGVRAHLASEWAIGMRQWVIAALITGAAFGALGNWAAHRSVMIRASALAAPFLGEALFRAFIERAYTGAAPLWCAEFAVGLAIGIALLTGQRRQRAESLAAGARTHHGRGVEC